MTDEAVGRTGVVPWLYYCLLPIHRLLLSLYFRQILIQGFEHLPVNGPVVLTPKHYSRWDPLVLAVLSVEPFWFMTNANQFRGIQGWFIRRLGGFPIDLERPKVSSFRYAVKLLDAGKKLVLFPEGGIVRDQPLRPLKPGFARLILQAEAGGKPQNIPIVPIALSYSSTPGWRAKIILRISPPLYSSDYWRGDEKQTAQALTQGVQEALLAGLAEINTGTPASVKSIND
jgi:1-acyl-sn-glycerol-3-phosphate acyltransferase